MEVRKKFLESGGEKPVEECVSSSSSEQNVALDEEQAGRIARFVEMDAKSGGPLALLSSDARVEEVAVIGPGKPVFVYLAGKGWLATPCIFTDLSALTNAINKLAKPLGRRVTAKKPRLNAVLENGCRIHASIPPVSGGEVTIRRFRSEPFSPADLISTKTFSAEAAAFLWLAVQSDASILIAGNTGSGKTSTLNALFSFIPLSERILLVEETPELRIPHPHSCRLVARDELGIGLGELSADSLRMRPDRVVIGEARDKGEVRALFDSMLSGQARGSYATVHARDSRDAIARLSSIGISESDLLALDLIVIQRREAAFKAGKFFEERRCTEICEVGFPAPERLFSFERKTGSLSMKSLGKRAAEKICATFGFDETGLSREVSRRAAFLSSLAERKPGFSDCLREIGGFDGSP
ncbi:Type II/IV secretion system protein [uncultured archaeon]|nr:Type II/IV secretion system protein [uncultured archaeon]